MVCLVVFEGWLYGLQVVVENSLEQSGRIIEIRDVWREKVRHVSLGTCTMKLLQDDIVASLKCNLRKVLLSLSRFGVHGGIDAFQADRRHMKP